MASPFDLGIGVDVRDDLPVGRWPIASGAHLLASDIYRRITSPQGCLLQHPDYGRDIRDLLGETATPSAFKGAEQAFAREVEKDPRVSQCQCLFVYDLPSSTMTATFQVTSALGPFTLVLSVNAVTAAIIEAP